MSFSTLNTKDLFLSAYLLSRDMNLNDMRVEQGGRVVFSFQDTNKLDELNRLYRSGNATCNVIKLRASLDYLKDEMFTLLRGSKLKSSGLRVLKSKSKICTYTQ